MEKKLHKITDFCCTRSNRGYRAATACQSLDFVEASHSDRVYPFMYCHMEIAGHLDISRLKAAIQNSAYYVPEILYIYSFRRARFVDIGLTADDTVIFEDNILGWDLSRKPQLQINIRRQGRQDIVIAGMSHILTDGEGFLQYLYLLASLYNGQSSDLPMRNCRELVPALENIRIQRQTEQTRCGKRKRVPRFLLGQAIKATYRLSSDFQLSISTFQNVCTLNCTMQGQPGDDMTGQFILERVKKELLEWLKDG